MSTEEKTEKKMITEAGTNLNIENKKLCSIFKKLIFLLCTFCLLHLRLSVSSCIALLIDSVCEAFMAPSWKWGPRVQVQRVKHEALLVEPLYGERQKLQRLRPNKKLLMLLGSEDVMSRERAPVSQEPPNPHPPSYTQLFLGLGFKPPP